MKASPTMSPGGGRGRFDLPNISASVNGNDRVTSAASTPYVTKGARGFRRGLDSPFLSPETSRGWGFTGTGSPLRGAGIDVADGEYSGMWTTGSAPRSTREALLMEHQEELARVLREQVALLASQRVAMISMQVEAASHADELRRARGGEVAPGAMVPNGRRFSRPPTPRVYDAEGVGGHDEFQSLRVSSGVGVGTETGYAATRRRTGVTPGNLGTNDGGGSGANASNIARAATAEGEARSLSDGAWSSSKPSATRMASAPEFRAGEAAAALHPFTADSRRPHVDSGNPSGVTSASTRPGTTGGRMLTAMSNSQSNFASAPACAFSSISVSASGMTPLPGQTSAADDRPNTAQPTASAGVGGRAHGKYGARAFSTGQPGAGPYLPNSVHSRSVAVQACATPWTRFYFPSVEQPNTGSPMLRHFDVFSADTRSVASGQPTELHSTHAFYGHSVPPFAQDMYTKMYFTTQLDQPVDHKSRDKWPRINAAEDEQQHRSLKSKSLHHDPKSNANLCMPESKEARVEIVKFLFFLTGLEPRNKEDESQLHRLRNAMLHHCATHMHEVGSTAAAQMEVRARELQADLQAQIVTAQEQVTLQVVHVEAELKLKYGTRLRVQKKLSSAVRSITRSIGRQQLGAEKQESSELLQRLYTAEARSEEADKQLEEIGKELDEHVQREIQREGEAKAAKQQTEELTRGLEMANERTHTAEATLKEKREEHANQVAAANEASEVAAAREKTLVTANGINMIKLRGDMETLRRNTVVKLKRKDEQWQGQVDHMHSEFEKVREVGGGGGGDASATAKLYFSSFVAAKSASGSGEAEQEVQLRTTEIKVDAMAVDAVAMDAASMDSVATDATTIDAVDMDATKVADLRGEVFDLNEQLRLMHTLVEEKDRKLKEVSQRAVEKQAELHREMRAKIEALTGELTSAATAASDKMDGQGAAEIELRDELARVKNDLVATEEALVNRVDEAGQMQRDTALALTQTKMTSLALNAKVQANEAKHMADNSEGAAAAAAALDEERQRAHTMALGLNQMHELLKEANRELTAMREAKVEREAADSDRLKRIREQTLVAGDDQMKQMVDLREYVAELERKAATDKVDSTAASNRLRRLWQAAAELTRIKLEASGAQAAAALAIEAAAEVGDAAAAHDIASGGVGTAGVSEEEEDAANAANAATAATAANATCARKNAPLKVRQAADIINQGAAAAVSMDPSMAVRALASLDPETSSDVFAKLSPDELGPIFAAAGAFQAANSPPGQTIVGSGGIVDNDDKDGSSGQELSGLDFLMAQAAAAAANTAEYRGAILSAFASAVAASILPEKAARALEVAARLSPGDTATFLHAMPPVFAASALGLLMPASAAEMLEAFIMAASTLIHSAHDDGSGRGLLETTARLVNALTPQAAAAVFEQLPSGVAAMICEHLPAVFIAHAVAYMSATCAAGIIVLLPDSKFAVEIISLVDPASHTAAVLSAMKLTKAVEVVSALSPKVALDVFTASLVPSSMATIIDAVTVEGTGGASIVAAAVFLVGDVERGVHEQQVAAVLSETNAATAGAVLCAGALSGNADRAAAVAALMKQPSAALALATAVKLDGKRKPLAAAVLAAMPVDAAAKLVNAAPHAVAADILAAYPPHVAISIIATGEAVPHA